MYVQDERAKIAPDNFFVLGPFQERKIMTNTHDLVN